MILKNRKIPQTFDNSNQASHRKGSKEVVDREDKNIDSTESRSENRVPPPMIVLRTE